MMLPPLHQSCKGMHNRRQSASNLCLCSNRLKSVSQEFLVICSLQALTNDSELNMENNIKKRDTQFISMFWLKTLENQMKFILLCILLEHTRAINLCFGMKHDLKHRKKRHNVFVRCFGTNN